MKAIFLFKFGTMAFECRPCVHMPFEMIEIKIHDSSSMWHWVCQYRMDVKEFI